MKIVKRYLSLILISWLFVTSGFADLTENPVVNAVPEDDVAGYVARIRLHTADEIKEVLEKAEAYIDGSDKFPNLDPIAVILHGPEVEVFSRENFEMYKGIVELAARLEAFNIIDVSICEVQMRASGIEAGDLPAFVNTVPFGPSETKRLLKKGYQYF